uniref:Uncharacterized protein n=1 Tax=Pithovirus LCDPAC02 TaxID=2506601 RepID=A0A481YPR3_9VIRU|nr:MAG: hypothetical protein LCDPAC02_01990 [Pithovirus LCDPAC02]
MDKKITVVKPGIFRDKSEEVGVYIFFQAVGIFLSILIFILPLVLAINKARNLKLILDKAKNEGKELTNIILDLNDQYQTNFKEGISGIINNENVLDEDLCILIKTAQSINTFEGRELIDLNTPDICNQNLDLKNKKC